MYAFTIFSQPPTSKRLPGRATRPFHFPRLFPRNICNTDESQYNPCVLYTQT
nr:MAG TPA: hypothetical protein [Caudoviricetes sp.]